MSVEWLASPVALSPAKAFKPTLNWVDLLKIPGGHVRWCAPGCATSFQASVQTPAATSPRFFPVARIAETKVNVWNTKVKCRLRISSAKIFHQRPKKLKISEAPRTHTCPRFGTPIAHTCACVHKCAQSAPRPPAPSLWW